MKKASLKDKKLVVEILVSAFEPLKEDNSINLVIKQDSKRIKRMEILMGYLFEKAILFGEVFISNNEKACLLIKFTHKEKITLKTIAMDIRLAVQSIGIERVFHVLKRQKAARKNYIEEDHIRPIITGVKKDYKGKGITGRLMLQVIKLYKDNTLPVIIDTASKNNVRLYQKLGFRIIKKEETMGFPIYFLRLN